MSDYLVLRLKESGTGSKAADWEPTLIVLDAETEDEAVDQAYAIGGQAAYKVLGWPDDKEFHAIASTPDIRELSRPAARPSPATE